MKETFSPLDIHHQLAKKIRLLREERGWSREDMSEHADLHSNYIGLVERCDVNVGLTNLEKLARAFGMPIHELLNMQTLETRNPPHGGLI